MSYSQSRKSRELAATVNKLLRAMLGALASCTLRPTLPLSLGHVSLFHALKCNLLPTGITWPNKSESVGRRVQEANAPSTPPVLMLKTQRCRHHYEEQLGSMPTAMGLPLTLRQRFPPTSPTVQRIGKKGRSPSSIEVQITSHSVLRLLSVEPHITSLLYSISLFRTSDHRPLVATFVLHSLRSLRYLSIIFNLQLRTFSRKGCHFQPNALEVSPFSATYGCCLACTRRPKSSLLPQRNILGVLQDFGVGDWR
ncbi:hypothetical protein SLEP1_g49723 [Rubroshorea leprosula]|uniref:Uncharacterized protein n=1 Tax=Rubroshorea leprosula TaxID=152421 RepID=A0AAV5M115_9ROSI|nr:hypothetical protein SLEP1_g49723 [Rubroshorea leprosula]